PLRKCSKSCVTGTPAKHCVPAMPADQGIHPYMDQSASDRSIRDLMGLLALPALWVGRDGQSILQIMIEAAERIVPMRFAMANVTHLADAPNLCVLRLDGRYVDAQARAEWETATAEWQQTRLPDGYVHELATPCQPMRVVRLSLGYGKFGGNIWFGSDQ